MTLDGNNTSHSHSVQLEKHQATAVFGVAFNYNHWGFVISTARGSDQFKTQRENTEFGSMSLTYQY